MRYDQTRLWATDAITCELILCVYMKVLMYECMNVRMYECDLNDHINCIWQMNRWNKTGHVRLEADWQRSTNTRQTSLELILSWTNRAIGGMKPGTRWQSMPLGKPTHCRSKVWEKSPFVNGNKVFFPRRALPIILYFCLWRSMILPGPPFRVFSPPGVNSFFVSLIFAWSALSGFQSTGTLSIA